MTTIVKTRTVHTNDSDVVALTGSTGNIMELLTINIEYTSSSTAGKRRVAIIVKDDLGNEMYQLKLHYKFLKNTTKHFTLMRGLEEDKLDLCDRIQEPLPYALLLLHNWTLTVKDSEEAAPTEDDMTITTIHRLIPSTSAEEIS